MTCLNGCGCSFFVKWGISGFSLDNYVDPENLPGLRITRNYFAWSYLAYYQLVL
jgi:hypothetical protein